MCDVCNGKSYSKNKEDYLSRIQHNTNGPVLLNAWGFGHLVSDRQKVLKTEQCLANIPSSTKYRGHTQKFEK